MVIAKMPANGDIEGQILAQHLDGTKGQALL